MYTILVSNPIAFSLASLNDYLETLKVNGLDQQIYLKLLKDFFLLQGSWKCLEPLEMRIGVCFHTIGCFSKMLTGLSFD